MVVVEIEIVTTEASSVRWGSRAEDSSIREWQEIWTACKKSCRGVW